MKKIALAVGHYGPGTGATFGPRDEFLMALNDAIALKTRLDYDGRVESTIICIDRRTPPWKYFPLSTSRQIQTKLAWLADLKPDVAIELHYNSFTDTSASGNVVCYLTPGRWVDTIDRAFRSGLPNLNRGPQKRHDLRILEAPCPMALIEPAFIFEPAVERGDWQALLVGTLAKATYTYFDLEA